MHKVLVIAGREYSANVRTKAFLISLVMMPILMGGGIAAQKFLHGRIDSEDRKIVVFDGTGELFELIAEDARRRNETEIRPPGSDRQMEPRYLLEAGPPGSLSNEQRYELSQRVRRHELHAFAEIDPSVRGSGRGDKAAVRFHSESVVSDDVSRWFRRVVAHAVQTRRLRDAGMDPVVVRRATAPVDVEVLGLYSKTSSGEIRPADEAGRTAAFFVPFAVMLLMFMSLMMSQTLLQNTLEEKQQKIAEVLLGSVTPFHLMLGKLVGNVGVSLTVVGLYLGGGLWMIHHWGYSHLVPPTLLAWFLVYQVLGVLIFGSVFAAIGAACNELKEAQNYLMPVMLVLVFPMMVWFNILKEPTSSFATWLSFFPPATPMLMVLRLSATAAVPAWQPCLGIATTVVATLVCVWLAGRIFRVGLLMQGKPPRLGEILRWAVRG